MSLARLLLETLENLSDSDEPDDTDESDTSSGTLRHSFFIYNAEGEALYNIREAYRTLFKDPVEPIRFDENGDLVYRTQKQIFLKGKADTEETDESIRLNRYQNEQLLQIELFDLDMEPNPDNIMLARYLAKKANTY